MPEDTFKGTLFAFILISLFGMLIVTAVISVGGNYGKDTSEIVGGSMALDKFNESISNVQDDAQGMQERFAKQSIWSAIAGVVVEGIFGIAKDMIVIILSPFAIITNILIDVLHIPAYVTYVMLALLIFGIIFSIWRLLKIGD